MEPEPGPGLTVTLLMTVTVRDSLGVHTRTEAQAPSHESAASGFRELRCTTSQMCESLCLSAGYAGHDILAYDVIL